MTQKLKKGDFVEVAYDGFVKEGSVLFDTTSEEQAKKSDVYSLHQTYESIIICLGKNQLLGNIDESLIGKSINEEQKVELKTEEAFGKKDPKLLKIVPLHVFKKDDIRPAPGLQVSVDGELGLVKTVSGGRVIVDFNHPLAGQDVYYKIQAKSFVKEDDKKIHAFLSLILGIPKNTIKVSLKESKAKIGLPFKLPDEVLKKLEEDIKEVVTSVTSFEFEQLKPEEIKDSFGRTLDDSHYGHHHN